ncbi:class I SAM-dependent methyltransferase [Komagataeibacter oboediens]|uniref:class I SAM-dependent methyltransferase n=1 Tax=Komagataeibacter oboediens TaxID=65958 RepID=UPI001C2C3ED4|nr:class I SAM-dependent methyltransferase [Komagataeibacter oboediens]MBV0887051.1 class I SAM-dependent methyltransferase [Komagataeibacter oboediens]MCK9820397.1 class I SAM-dependent methyltransferase [Komagataeibacter oboediens]
MECPSITAWRVARHRARHQLLEKGAVFADPLAVLISDGDSAQPGMEEDAPGEKNFRLFMAIRSRIAEDRLAAAVRRGVPQAVVLGAGLDTLGLRSPHGKDGLTVFEVDRPAMQDWKRGHIARLGIAAPDTLTFVAADFERDDLVDCLVHAGFDPDRPAFFSWLGVVPYLGRDSIEKTLRFVATIPDAEIVFDYGEPVENYAGDRRKLMEERAHFVSSVGEPWLSRFTPADMHDILRKAGFNHVTDYDRAGISAYFGWPVRQPMSGAGPHVIDACMDGYEM